MRRGSVLHCASTLILDFPVRAPRSYLCLAVLLAMVAAGSASAKQIYQYRDANGQLHYTDKPPEQGEAKGEVRRPLVKGEAAPIVDLSSTEDGDGRHYSLANRLAGPVGVRLSLENAEGLVSDPPAPFETVLAALKDEPVLVVRRGDPETEQRYEAKLVAVPGNPEATPVENFEYQSPIPAGTVYSIPQGFGGPLSHAELAAFHSVDFAVDAGTPVLAARPGTVMQLESDFVGAGLNKERFGGRPTLVRILHSDGSMAVYAHLQPESISVVLGQQVKGGQQIATSGNSGFNAAPHLHFSIQANRHMTLQTIAFRIRGVRIPGA